MVIPLPVNSTAVNQPLDVDVMGPLNRIVRALGLMGQTITKKEKEQGKKKTAQEKGMMLIKRTITAWELISPKPLLKLSRNQSRSAPPCRCNNKCECANVCFTIWFLLCHLITYINIYY
ncbi:hypothetical protein JG687_00016840 [Phytophthora cactorum]|uniref:DDE-1 domain-containing protein n=1 Tax=Phytophthora cactorum TaxID=29920 RepID=A0A8T1TUU1_9STRA|nr:hypothetical protein JG687_00016840 [Phytophthora cactorum]